MWAGVAMKFWTAFLVVVAICVPTCVSADGADKLSEGEIAAYKDTCSDAVDLVTP